MTNAKSFIVQSPVLKFFFFFMYWQPSFPRNDLAKCVTPICLSLEDIDVSAGHKVLTEVRCIMVIVGDPKGATTLSITTLSLTRLSIMTLSITTLSISTIRIMTLSITTLSITTLSMIIHKTRHSALWQSVIMLSVVLAECHFCWVSHVSLLCWVSLWRMLLCWV